jgi:hypothetical protein
MSLTNTVERFETHHLRYNFTEDELKEFSRTMAREAQDLAAAEDQKKVAVAQFAEEIARHKSVVSQMARHINNGYEMRMVRCGVALDKPARGRAEITRLDSGEVVRERAMTEEETKESNQGKLPLAAESPEQPPAKAKGAAKGKS